VTKNDQDQNVGTGSSAVQAGRDVTVSIIGGSISEMRQIALDVYRANFYELVGAAKETASARAEEITETFLLKLQRENPSGFQKAGDPDFLSALFTVQKEYANSGDKDLGSLLVDLLVDRSKQKQRGIMQLVLNESLKTAPKLTDNQLAVLAMAFLFKYTKRSKIASHEELGGHLDAYAAPFASKIVGNNACFQHLEFCGCGSIGAGTVALEHILGNNYQGLFLKGFNEIEISKRAITVGYDTRLFSPCLNDETKLQVSATDGEALNQALKSCGTPAEDWPKIATLFNQYKMADPEIRDTCVSIRPYMAHVFEVWSGSLMKHFMLTSVGIAIAHANIKRLAGEFADLSIWIN
jgi:hypothetical protein